MSKPTILAKGLIQPSYQQIEQRASSPQDPIWGQATTLSWALGDSILLDEMRSSISLIRNFSPKLHPIIVGEIHRVDEFFFVGSGSSTLFPGAIALNFAKLNGTFANKISITACSPVDAMSYPFYNSLVVFGSNSGESKEPRELAKKNFPDGRPGTSAINAVPIAITANPDSSLGNMFNPENVIPLTCGKERCVAATMSVVEQALLQQYLVALRFNREDLFSHDNMEKLATAFDTAFTAHIDPNISWTVGQAGTIYSVGNVPGVPGEIRQKAIEILGYGTTAVALQSTLIFHGEKEVLKPTDVVLYFGPDRENREKLQELKRDTDTPTVIICEDIDREYWCDLAESHQGFYVVSIPSVHSEFLPYVYLAAGWNILVNAGVAKGRNIDQTEKATKVGY